MTEEIKKEPLTKNEIDKLNKKFYKIYPETAIMMSYYSWEDATPRFRVTDNNIRVEFNVDPKNNMQINGIPTLTINIEPKERMTAINNPTGYVKDMLFGSSKAVLSEKNVIDFAQDTILRAIKGL